MSRVGAVCAAWIATVVLVVSCSTTSGTPVPEQTETAAAPAPAVPGAPTTTPPPPPPPPSDEEQIRAAVEGLIEASNTENWDAYLSLMCPNMREKHTGSVMDIVRQERTRNGIVRIKAIEVNVTGDTAIATVESSSEIGASGKMDIRVVRGDDGWQTCMTF